MTTIFSDLLDEAGAPRDGAPLGALMTAQAMRAPDLPALTVDGITVSRAELDSAANRRARHYAALGVGIDDVVLIALPNGRAFYEAVLAIWKLGASPAHVSYRLTEGEFVDIVELAQPKLVVGGLMLSQWRGARMAEDEPILTFSDAPLEPRASKCWKIATTGGSTGRPKLVVDACPARWAPEKAALRREPGATILNPAPLYHAAPFGFIIPALLHGCHIVDMGRFEAERWLALVDQYGPDWVYLVPTMMTRIARLPAEVRARYRLGSIRTLLHIAAPCPEWTKRFWIDQLGAEAVWEIYGGAERFGSTLISGEEWLAHPGSVGRAASGIEASIRDERGASLPVGEVGEIFFRRDGGRTTQVRSFEGGDTGTFDWASFGDLGWMDDDGYIYIADRRADMIVSGGTNLYPAEIEAALDSHSLVLGAVVVGLPDDDLGRRAHAIVQIAPDAVGTVNEADLLDYLATRLAPTKHPRSIEFTTRTIRDDAGKVRRGAWRDEVLARQTAIEQGVSR